MDRSFEIRARLVDLDQRSISPVLLQVAGGRISSCTVLTPEPQEVLPFLLPGFIDAHVHIESSMLIPSEFARLAVTHGTVATVSDPHEIANVCGMEGVEFMLRDAARVPFHFFFGAPSCVPATAFETAGASLGPAEVRNLLERPEICYLSEMMNFPGVIGRDPEVMAKLEAARELEKPIDGHAPGLSGEALRSYVNAGISSDHECFTEAEAREKLELGMKIIIREGSAAKNFEALIPLLAEWPDRIMFCSDDKHPDSLVEGHIDRLCARAVAAGMDVFDVLRAACLNPILHYGLPLSRLHPGDPADFILAEDLNDFRVLATYIAGEVAAAGGRSLIPPQAQMEAVNRFDCEPVRAGSLALAADQYPAYEGLIPVIEALDGQLITNKLLLPPKTVDGLLSSDPDRDILKIAVINRYRAAKPAIAFIRNFGLRAGAIASSVAHDSHNIVAVGSDDEVLSRAINLVIGAQGGVSCVGPGFEEVLALPVAGLMSSEDGYAVARRYTMIDACAKSLGSPLAAPFMTLSFMALLVIPHLKLSDLGLFDGDRFCFEGRS